jgi:hypothetical protein
MSLLNRKMNGHAKDPYRDPTSIGNLAVLRGYATFEQVAAALKKQEERQPIGKILVEQGVLTEVQLEELLIEQEIKRKRLNTREAAKLWSEFRHDKMREVTKGLRDVTASLTLLAKT